MTKKTTTTRSPTAAEAAPKDFEEIYTAHQVHTLAQITLGQLAGSNWFAGPGNAMPGPSAYGATGAGMHGLVPPQPLIYWYP